MIRLPPSVICLASSDLLDYESRRLQRELEDVKQQLDRFEVGAPYDPKFGRPRKTQVLYKVPMRNTSSQAPLFPIFGGADSSEDLLGFSTVASPENISIELLQSSSPLKDTFHYGGFVHRSYHSMDNTSHHSSPFAPDDVSTPQNLLPPHPAYRSRTLPRSPLYLSQNASSSPERRPTSSLTPRVASRVANHNTPGLIFSQPARRPATFRHQMNSFSFDSSERASAAYEQDRTSSLSTTDSTSRPPLLFRLRDELRGSSLSSSQVHNETDELQSLYSEEGGIDLAYETPTQARPENDVNISSPRISLPPPFSAASRSVSDTSSLPSTVEHNPRYSSNRLSDPHISSPLNLSPELSERHGRNPSVSPLTSPSRSLNPASGVNDSPRYNPIRLLRAGAVRIVSFYRPRSTHSSNRSGVQSLLARYPQTPSRAISIYNDRLPPATQPQSPAHLPESRHQSRFHSSLTAPVVRARSGIFSIVNPDIVPSRDLERRHRRAPTTPSRGTRNRAASPLGLQNGGFRGLYGGRENGDEEQDWVDGVRFSNAEVRLWGLRDAAADVRTLGETPDRDEWQIGRH